MIEPIFVPGNKPAMPAVGDTNPEAMLIARDKALLWRATNLAIESAFRFGKDLPVGAAAAAGDWIVGRYFASDNRNNLRQMHAEYMAVMDADMLNRRSATSMPDTVIATLEPCDNCQDFLATVPTIRRVGFGLPREEISNRGLVRPHSETIFQRALRKHLPYKVIQIEDPSLHEAGRVILDHTRRNPETEMVEVDPRGLNLALTELNER